LKTYNFHEDQDWQAYKKKLEGLNYFNGETQGSNLYRQLEDKAKAKYFASKKYNATPVQSEINAKAIAVEQIDKILQHANLSKDDFPPSKVLPTDSDDWLQISPKEVDRLLAEKQEELIKYTEQIGKEEKSNNTSAPSQLSEDNLFDSMVNDMKSFVSKVSSFEGADFPTKFGTAFDSDKVLKLMQQTLGNEGVQEQNQDEEVSSDEGEEFYDGGDSPEEIDEFKDEWTEFQAVLQQMDAELSQTEVGKSFETVPDSTEADGKPVDVNLNLVKNFMDSYEAQHGLSGPVSIILSEMTQKDTQ